MKVMFQCCCQCLSGATADRFRMLQIILIFLFAITPIVGAKADNDAKAIQTSTNIKQSQGKVAVIFTEKFVDKIGYTIYVNGVNTKGATDNIDVIYLDIKNFQTEAFETYTVKSVTDRELYVLSSNGVKEGPLRLTHVVAASQESGELESFITPTMTNYVKALIAHPYNKTGIELESDVSYIVYNEQEWENHGIINQEGIKDFTWPMINTGNMENFGELVPSFTREIQGSYGVYTIRLYKKDTKEYYGGHCITLQKEGEDEFRLRKTYKTDIVIDAFDAIIPCGTIFEIFTYAGSKTNKVNVFTDDLLGAELYKIWNEGYHYFYVSGENSYSSLTITPHGENYDDYNVLLHKYPYSYLRHAMYKVRLEKFVDDVKKFEESRKN